MNIAVIQAASQKDKNSLLFECVLKSVEKLDYKVVNFGIYTEEEANYSYIQTAINISLLLESKAIDFVVTGCSSGQGMMLACNSLPGVFCGYIPTPSDAYLFGRINDGNAASFPLGLNFGWAGEINLQCTLNKLFEEPFGIGYPKEDAIRKQEDTRKLKEINGITKRNLIEILPLLDKNLLASALQRKVVFEYIIKHGKNPELIEAISQLISKNDRKVTLGEQR